MYKREVMLLWTFKSDSKRSHVHADLHSGASVRLVLARWILGVITQTWTQLFLPCWDLSWRPGDAFAAVSLRLMTPHPVCEKAISAAFNSLFPMITRRIYHTRRAASGCVLVYVCVFGWQSVRGSPLLVIGGNIFLYRQVEKGRREEIHFTFLAETEEERLYGPTCLHRREVL